MDQVEARCNKRDMDLIGPVVLNLYRNLGFVSDGCGGKDSRDSYEDFRASMVELCEKCFCREIKFNAGA
ncbi:hypothetical protein Hdeb2414_s1104g00982331 [Helianthus debilis subsp. tardiflorus]